MTNKIDFYTYTLNHAQYLKDTYDNFFKYCNDYKSFEKTLYLNIDPYVENYITEKDKETNIQKIKDIADTYFDYVVIRTPDKCDMTDAFYWAAEQIKSPQFFLLYCYITHGGNCIKKEFSLNHICERLDKYNDVCQICLMTNNSDYIEYLTCCPTLWKTDYIKNIYLENGSKYVQERYVLRELALLENLRGLTYEKTNSDKYYPSKLSKSSDYETNLLLPTIQNISSDSKIGEIIDNYGEWHNKVLNIYQQKDNVDKNRLNNIFKKTKDKEWIYRWTGVFSFIPKHMVNPNNRMQRSSRHFLCNR